MSYIWFNQVLEALGRRLNFESISNLFGNSFMQKAQEVIHAANPLLKNVSNAQSGLSVADLPGSIKIIQKKAEDTARTGFDLRKDAESALGDLGWAKEFFDNRKTTKE